MKVFLNEVIHPKALELLKEKAEVIEDIDRVDEVDAIIVRAFPITREDIEKAKNLKVIAKHGVGYNNIDIEACREHGIKVLYTPTTNINSVAELIVGLAIALCRSITKADTGCRKGAYKKIAPKELTGLEITGKTLGLIGTGNIAQIAADMMRKAFHVNVVGYDPYISREKAAELGIEKIEKLEELIEVSDVVSISVPLTSETKDMISGGIFDHFKPTAVLINTARGGIINEDDLYKALKEGKLKAAACDAFVSEPPTGSESLLTLDNFIATPHIGGTTEEALYRTGMETVEDMLTVLNGGEAKHPVC